MKKTLLSISLILIGLYLAFVQVNQSQDMAPLDYKDDIELFEKKLV